MSVLDINTGADTTSNVFRNASNRMIGMTPIEKLGVTAEDPGLLDGLAGLGKYKDAVGLTGGIYGLYDNIFGLGGDIRNSQLDILRGQGKLLNQQIASNKQSMADRKQFNKNWSNASNKVMNGLGKVS